MIITDKFVFLHFPKTGGLFVADVLKKVHERIKQRAPSNPPLCRELLLPNLKRINGSGVNNVHGTYEQIPDEYRDRPIISCIRDPFDRYVSTYEFRNWVQQRPGDLERILSEYPAFPKLSFKQYLKFINVYDINSRTGHELLKVDIGMITFAFIQFFFKDPMRTFRAMDDGYLESDQYRRDMPEVKFLHTEDLNRELHDLLLGFGYETGDISFIINEPRVNATPQRKEKNDWERYYDQALYDQVKRKERFLFKLFPEYLKRTP